MPRLILLFLALSFSCSALTIIPAPEGERKHAAMVKHNEACIRQLQSVTDRRSADAAARAIAALKRKLRYDSFDYSEERVRMEQLSSALHEKYFYGSTALAEALSYPVKDALLPSHVTPELLCSMEADAKRRIGRREDIEELDRIYEADETVLNHLYEALSIPDCERTACALAAMRNAGGHGDNDLHEALKKYLTPPVAH